VAIWSWDSLLKEGVLRELREEAGEELQVENVQFLGVCNILDFSPTPLFPVVARYLEAYKTGEACLDT
jgi:hypothetical protein